MSVTTPIESGNRIQVPAEWLAELGIGEKVVLEKTSQGIIIRPTSLTWEEVFAKKLTVGQIPFESEIEETSDDLLF